MIEYPTTSAALVDLCFELFGLGDYDEETATEPFFKVRMREIAKVNALCKKRGIEVRSMAIAAYYCSREGIVIRRIGELIPHIVHALMDLRHREALEKYRQIEQRRSELIEKALDVEDFELAKELMRVELRLGMTDAVFAFAAERLGLS